ncbi:MAG: sugar ABC transporter permease [Chloroflexia bacterium]|nr:sugar ABC transporter permease [Chloroflexia bacterium]
MATTETTAGTVGTERPSVSPTRQWLSRYLPLYLAISPFYLLFLVFGLFPIGFAFYLAFQSWDGIGPMQYVGFEQFRYLLTDEIFLKSIVNTFQIWIISTVPMLLLALGLAFLLNQPLKGKTAYRIAFFLPNVTSLVAIAIIFTSIFGNEFGLLNAVIRGLGAERFAWLDDEWGIKVAIATMVVWRWTGYNAIVYLAGLQAIPDDLYDAAKIDGATTWKLFTDITVPLLRPVILFTVIISTIGGMQLFTEPQILVGNTGGPGQEGLTMVLYLYEQAFVQNQFGYGAAIGWGLFVIIVAFSLFNWKVLNRPGDS